MYKNLILPGKKIWRISGQKKNGLAKKSNCFCFTLCGLGMESVMVRMVWLHENEGGCSVSTIEKGKCSQGINTQSPSPQANVVQKGPHTSSSTTCTRKKTTNLGQSLKYIFVLGKFFIQPTTFWHESWQSHTQPMMQNAITLTTKISIFCTVPTTLERTKFLLTLKAVS